MREGGQYPVTECKADSHVFPSLPFPTFHPKPLCTSPLTPIPLLQATLFPDLHHYSHPIPFLLAMKRTPSGSHCMVGRPFISSHTSIKPSPAPSQLPAHHRGSELCGARCYDGN
ncbi:hypothetical protein BHE74_00032709 [Ensete ventricosum]|nr:hypothetical protein GW17_00055136 [Ensete ventricosum]RWW60302.1 hypothetical protein BHE74_00032709 [Ensete ventricosum]